MKPINSLPPIEGLSLVETELMLCFAHYLARRHLPGSVVPGDHPAAVPHSALNRHFSATTTADLLSQLQQRGLVEKHASVTNAHYLTEAGVSVLGSAKIIPWDFAHNFGDYPTPDAAEPDLEQGDDEDDDDFEQRYSDAHMELLDELDYEMDRWAECVWETPEFMNDGLERVSSESDV